jgi:hypothetical protein
MNLHRTGHLTADELDAFLTQSPSPAATSHLATCAACATMAERDRHLVAELAALPYFDPRSDFGDAVMHRVAMPAMPLAVAAAGKSARAIAARRRAIGVLVLAGGGIAAGFAWALAHPTDAAQWTSPALRDVGHSLWLSLQTIVANATAQPWFSSVRDSMATPGRALVALAGFAAVYAVGLLGLRRLMSEPATHASW